MIDLKLDEHYYAILIYSAGQGLNTVPAWRQSKTTDGLAVPSGSPCPKELSG